MRGWRWPEIEHVVSGVIMQVNESRKDSGARTEIDLDRATDRYSLRRVLPVPRRDDPAVPDEDASIMEDRSSRIHRYDSATEENALCRVKGLSKRRSEGKGGCERATQEKFPSGNRSGGPNL
jgi:hypothetical protein